MFTAYNYSCGVQQNLIFYFIIFFVIYYIFSKICQNKRKKKGKPRRGGYMFGFTSLRRRNTRFSSLRCKSKLLTRGGK